MAVKLPNAAILKSHLEAGLDKAQIAARYGVHRDTVRTTLIRFGIDHLDKAPRQSASRRITRHSVRESVTVQADRVVLIREMIAGENGGTALRCLSLPRISMHVAALQERGL
ncbi:helix-turn-helix domain-containing protein [Rhizobium sp. BK060]|uniref:helix-turn-helix domain-containing protein n=1 Tax=Rhizobium sp. BK060 TaxID=2587096 RepID=UPI0016162D56|nr:helix-turn-helix domain-containing protein [Rhizobium sp. BK060]MBB3396844.1 transposase [Rhizobium sp. BK060]